MSVFERLRALNEPVPKPPALPTRARLEEVERTLGVRFPPSYREYQLTCSDVTAGVYEPYWLHASGDYADLVASAREAWETVGLPRHLLPVVEDNGDYYCLDTSHPGPEHPVVFWSHDALFPERRWTSFADWVEQVWIAETVEQRSE